MKKKAVILLITLFFISVISLVILKNLDDSEKFFNEVTFDTVSNQVMISDKNIKDELLGLIKRYNDDDEIDKILEITSSGVPLEYGDINLTLSMSDYTFQDCYLNDITTPEKLIDNCDEYTSNNILYLYDFVELLKSFGNNINTKEKLDYFLTKYKQNTKDDKIDLVKDRFEVIKMPPEDSNSSKRYLQCDYILRVSDKNVSCSFIIESTANGEPKIVSNTISY